MSPSRPKPAAIAPTTPHHGSLDFFAPVVTVSALLLMVGVPLIWWIDSLVIDGARLGLPSAAIAQRADGFSGGIVARLGVALGGGERRVAEQYLDGAEVDAVV